MDENLELYTQVHKNPASYSCVNQAELASSDC